MTIAWNHPLTRSLARALLLAACLLLPLVAVAQDYDALKPGVVKIVSTDPEGVTRTGTGFIVRLDGEAAYILTAAHVVEGDPRPRVEFYTRQNFLTEADIVRVEGGEPRGLALLIVRGKEKLAPGLSALPMRDSSSLTGGEPVVAIGFPQVGGPWAVVPATVVARIGRHITLSGAIDEGNAGGPVLSSGAVVAVVVEERGKFIVSVPAAIARMTVEGWGVEPVASRAQSADATSASSVEPMEALIHGVVKVVSTDLQGKRHTGAGFIVKLEKDVAYILTANHVVEGDKRPLMYFYARRDISVHAETVKNDARLDAALLIVRGRDNLPSEARVLPLRAEDSLNRGDEVTTIGFPASLGEWAVTRATVASRDGSDLTLAGSIDNGSSGGPVVREGVVVAMVTAADRMAGRATPVSILRYALTKGWGVLLAESQPGPTAPPRVPEREVAASAAPAADRAIEPTAADTGSGKDASTPDIGKQVTLYQQQYRARTVVLGRDYPRLALQKGWEGTTVVRIIIGRDGKVRDLGISSSSGHLVLDERALEIAKGIRMPPLPPELTGREFFIDLPVSFKLDKG